MGLDHLGRESGDGEDRAKKTETETLQPSDLSRQLSQVSLSSESPNHTKKM